MVRLNLVDALLCQGDLSCKYVLLVQRDKMFEAVVILVSIYWSHLCVQLSFERVTGLTVTMATMGMKFKRSLLLNYRCGLRPFLPWYLNSVHYLDIWERLYRFF